MTAITETLSSALIHFIWQGTLVACLLWIALFMLRNRSANARYLASVTALMALAVTPVVTAYLAYDSSAPFSLAPAPPTAPAAGLSSDGARSVLPRGPWLDWVQSWALTAWSVGVLVFSVRMAWCYAHVHALRRRGEPPDQEVLMAVKNLAERLGIDRPIRVLISAMADGPSVVGWLRPVILLPAANVLGLTQEQLEAVIAHEIAHIRRHDYLVSALQVVVETILFYHPAVWWTSARIRHERELCCDDLAVQCCGDALCYARALTKLERLRVMKPRLAVGSTDGSLLYRIQRIVGVRTREHVHMKLAGTLVLLIGCAGFLFNLNWARAESHAAQEPGTAARVKDQAGVSVNLGASSVLHRTPIEYPKEAFQTGIQGSLAVEATVDHSGNVVDARVLSGPLELRRATLQSVFEWHFAPDGPGTRVVHVMFDLTAAAQLTEDRGSIGIAAFEAKGPEAEKFEAELVDLKMTLAKELKLTHVELLEDVKYKIRYVDELKSQNDFYREAVDEDARLRERAHDGLPHEGEPPNGNMDAPACLTCHGSPGKRIYDDTVALKVAVFGQPLTGIRVVGLTDQLQQQLLSRLPARPGEILSREVVDTITTAVHQFDEHLIVRLLTAEDGGTEIVIIAPGA